MSIAQGDPQALALKYTSFPHFVQTMASPGSLLNESSGSSPIPPQDIDPPSAIQEPLIILIIVACDSGILIPVLILLFFFSTPSLRRKPVFILNVVSVMFGIGVGCMTIFQAVCTTTFLTYAGCLLPYRTL